MLPIVTHEGAKPRRANDTAMARATVRVLVILIPAALALYFSTGVKPVLYAIYGLLALLLASSLSQMVGERSHLPVHRWYAGLATALVFSTALALIRPDSAIDRNKLEALVLALCWCGAVFPIYVAVRRAQEIDSALTAFGVAGWVLSGSVYASALLWLAGMSFGEVLEFDGSIRAFGPLGDQVAFVLTLFVLVSAGRSAWVPTAAHTGALLLTASRGAFGCLLIGFIVLNLLPGRAPSRPSVRMFRSLAAAAVVIALLLSPAGSLLLERTLTNDPATRYGGRLDAIQTGVAVIGQHPLAGVGFYGFEQARWEVYSSAFVDQYTDRSFATAANQLVQTGTDGGVPALLLLVGLFTVIVRAAWTSPLLRDPRRRPQIAGFAAWVVAMIVGNQTSPWLLPDATLGYYLMSVVGLLEAARSLNIARVPIPGPRTSMRRLVNPAPHLPQALAS